MVAEIKTEKQAEVLGWLADGKHRSILILNANGDSLVCDTERDLTIEKTWFQVNLRPPRRRLLLNLVADGLLKEWATVGAKPFYEITEAGRKAVDAWRNKHKTKPMAAKRKRITVVRSSSLVDGFVVTGSMNTIKYLPGDGITTEHANILCDAPNVDFVVKDR